MKVKTEWRDADEYNKSKAPNYLHYWLGSNRIADFRWVNCWGRKLGNVKMYTNDDYDGYRVSKIIGDEDES